MLCLHQLDLFPQKQGHSGEALAGCAFWLQLLCTCQLFSPLQDVVSELQESAGSNAHILGKHMSAK